MTRRRFLAPWAYFACVTLPIAFVLGALVWITEPWSQVEFTGPAVVVDGDTIKVKGITWRLEGIDAPELRQPCLDAKHRCGVIAAVLLAEIVKGSLVSCRATGTQSYNRMVGVCRMNGQDLGEIMVRNGLAYDWPRYSGGRYAAAMPRGELMFERPWEWRARNRDGGSR